MSSQEKGQEWLSYYERFPYFNSDLIREGCSPRVFEHETATEKAIVLVHGLSDSPYFMLDLARYFFSNLNYNVYVPLLQCHGLKNPGDMEGVDLEEWKKNVKFAIEVATTKANEVSIGGLSTGGALSFLMAATDSRVNGSLFLFSAALDLAGGIWGQFKEKILRTSIADLVDKQQKKLSLIGENPYRYARVDKGGAKQLSRLIKEIDTLIEKDEAEALFVKPAFAAHSECDTTTSITGITKLIDYFEPGKFTFFCIPEAAGVPHASVVLKNPIYAMGALPGDKPLEVANNKFEEMTKAMAGFVEVHGHSVVD